MSITTAFIIYVVLGAMSSLFIYPLVCRTNKPFRSLIDDAFDVGFGGIMSAIIPALPIIAIVLIIMVNCITRAAKMYTCWFNLVAHGHRRRDRC